MTSHPTGRGATRAPEATCWLGYAAMGVAYNILGPVLPALRGVLGTGYSGLAVLFVAAGAGTALGTLVGNRLLDRVGYRRLLLAAGAAYGAALLLMFSIHALALWALLSAVSGLSGASIDIAGARYVAGSRESGRSRAMNVLNVFYGIGGLAAPAAVGLLASAGADVLWAYVLAAGAMLGVAAMALATMGPGRPQTVGASAAAAWRWALGQRPLVRLAVVIVLYVGVEVAFAGWIASFAHVRDRLTLAEASLFPLLFFAALTAGRSIASERARHWSETSLVAAGMATALAGGIACLAGVGPYVLAAGVVLVGAGYGPVFPTVFALAARRTPARQSEAYGLLFVSSSVGMLTLPWLTGQAFAARGAWVGLALPVAATALMGLVFAYASLRDRDRDRASPAASAGAAS